MKIDSKTDTLWKTYLVYFLVLLFGIAVIVKIILVQTKDSQELKQLAEKREYRLKEIEASRGNIFSADGQLMATTIPLYDVFFDYKSVDSAYLAANIDSLCRQMAQLFPKRNPAQWKAHFEEGCRSKEYLSVCDSVFNKIFFEFIKNDAEIFYRRVHTLDFNEGLDEAVKIMVREEVFLFFFRHFFAVFVLVPGGCTAVQ